MAGKGKFIASGRAELFRRAPAARFYVDGFIADHYHPRRPKPKEGLRMEKPPRTAALIYGYAVCLVAIITLLISIPNMVNSIIDLSDPLYAGGYYSPGKQANLASYEIYKMEILSAPQEATKSGQAAYIPDETTLRVMYEAARADRIALATHIARRTIIVFALLTVISVVIFWIHFRWMRSLARST